MKTHGVFPAVLLLILLWSHQTIAQGRTFIDLPQERQILNLADQDIYKAIMFSVAGSNIYFFDYGEYRLIRYRDGAFDTIAKGIGGGPQEFRNPTGLATDNKGNIWVADPEQARVSIWNSRGELLDTFNHNNSIPEGIAVYEDYYMLRVREFSSNSVFNIFDENQTRIGSFGGIQDSLTASRFLVSGSIHADESGFYYAPEYAGYLYKFDSGGNKIFDRQTVEPMPIGEISNTTEEIPGIGTARVKRPPSDEFRATLDIATDEKFLYVLFAGNEDGIGQFIDIYDKTDGTYHSSIKLDITATDLEVDNGKFYVLYYDPPQEAYNLLMVNVPGT